MQKALLIAGSGLLIGGCQPPAAQGTDCKLVANTAMVISFDQASRTSGPNLRPQAKDPSHEYDVAWDLAKRDPRGDYSSYYEACRRIEVDGL